MGSDSTNDGDREALAEIATQAVRLRPANAERIADAILAAGYRRVPTPPLPESPGEFARLHAAWVTARQCVRDMRSASTWTEVREILTAYDQRNHAPTPTEAETNPPGVDLYCVARKCVMDWIIFGKGATFAEAIADLKEHESRALAFESDDPIADWRELPTSAPTPPEAVGVLCDIMLKVVRYEAKVTPSHDRANLTRDCLAALVARVDRAEAQRDAAVAEAAMMRAALDELAACNDLRVRACVSSGPIEWMALRDEYDRREALAWAAHVAAAPAAKGTT